MWNDWNYMVVWASFGIALLWYWNENWPFPVLWPLLNFPKFVVIHTVKGFLLVSEAEIDVLLEFPCFIYNLMDVGNLISGSSAFYKSSLHIWKFSVHILLKPSLKDFEHNLTSTWNEHNCTIVWTFFGIALLWDWNENTFSSRVATAGFSKFADLLSAELKQHHLLGFEIAQLEFHHLHCVRSDAS